MVFLRLCKCCMVQEFACHNIHPLRSHYSSWKTQLEKLIVFPIFALMKKFKDKSSWFTLILVMYHPWSCIICENVAWYRSLIVTTVIPFVAIIRSETTQLTKNIVWPIIDLMTVCKYKSSYFTLFSLFTIHGVSLSVHEVHLCNFLGGSKFKAFSIVTFDRNLDFTNSGCEVSCFSTTRLCS